MMKGQVSRRLQENHCCNPHECPEKAAPLYSFWTRLLGKFRDNNVHFAMRISLFLLKMGGIWCPESVTGCMKVLYYIYTFLALMCVLGSYMFSQLTELFLNWGDIAVMTAVSFVLLTDLVQTVKIGNFLIRRKKIKKIVHEANEALSLQMKTDGNTFIIKRSNRECNTLLLIYVTLTLITLLGWTGSVDTSLKQLPMRAWYPYNTTRSPAYELTYIHQTGMIYISASLNIAKDCLTTTLIAQTRCRLLMLNEGLKNLHRDIVVNEKQTALLSPVQEEVVLDRLQKCVKLHQSALGAAAELQECFSMPTLGQFLVSTVVICVTAFQLASQTGNFVRFISMFTYLINMIYQVFLYCYQGNQIRDESADVSSNAYSCRWYASSIKFRRALLVLMIQARHPITLKAGGFTTLSLESFMAIVKTSYSFFTVLQRVGDKDQKNKF